MTQISAVARRQDTERASTPLIVTGAMVLIVISLVVPLPPGLLDFGIALSIATATLVLVMAALVERPTDFQAFPVLLLVSLIIRLSLNVSSTRLILAEGHTGTDAAGQVISGFADFVAGGSLLVGLTVFAVISVVNFMVITKGSGRMAEVSARFALDSLPGKQLAIDGDLSSGAISHEEAKQRRIAEQREISFFGSLDGASKFVKGDAVAGIVITLINLLVGLSVGILVHGMPVSAALSTYSHLTIGDGLVSQIPSLITSMAAALLLSRGGATETTAKLISHEFMARWHGPAVVAGAMTLMSFVPGMPRLLFLSIAAALALLALHIARRDPALANDLPEVAGPDEAETQARIGDLLDTDEISVEIGTELVLTALDQSRGLGTRIGNLRIHIARHYGLILPDVRITDNPELAGGEYQIRVQGVIRGRGSLRSDQVLALGPDEVLSNLPGAVVREPVYGSPARWLPTDQQEEASMAGATVVSPMEIISTHLMEVVRSNLAALMTMAAMQRQIEELKSLSDPSRAERHRLYFDSMLPEKVAPDMLLAVLRALLTESISIRNLPLIVDALYEYRGVDNPEMIYELVRKRLRDQITQQLRDGSGVLSVIQLHPGWESEFVQVETENARGGGGALTPALAQKFAAAAKQTIASVNTRGDAVVAAPDHRRRAVRNILNANGVPIPVLSLDEIDPGTELRLIGTIEAA
ncbi:flagellar biosynthesis protein FlhA [Paracoccus tegillarcae]|uniref:Flagellar biosynthesis protein FlhA n=1 Tax=Paracoccus tegillarcae TaxID=1529068 RepID=A0A2K9EFP9_9RHOB|nr:flagellar biosynthesis protein FlhA [Paracoccus tegillarcae]AUH33763.1 flagellar biosynthesis protein FlhA [Paracoccus tegillarcae]